MKHISHSWSQFKDHTRWRVVGRGWQRGRTITKHEHLKIRPFSNRQIFIWLFQRQNWGAIVSINLQRVQIENITLCLDSEISLSSKCNQSLSDRPLNWNKSHEAGRNHRHCAWLCHLIGLKRIPSYAGWLIAPLPQSLQSAQACSDYSHPDWVTLGGWLFLMCLLRKIVTL